MTSCAVPPTSIVNRFGTAPKSRSKLSTSRGRQRHAGVPSVFTAKIASSYGGIGGGGSSVAGSVSVSQLPEAVKIRDRPASYATEDQRKAQPSGMRGWSQPERVERKPAGRPRSLSLW